jgi:hypothetical protein
MVIPLSTLAKAKQHQSCTKNNHVRQAQVVQPSNLGGHHLVNLTQPKTSSIRGLPLGTQVPLDPSPAGILESAHG